MEITKTLVCRCCGKRQTVKLPFEGYLQWRNGVRYIQDAMPQVPEGIRELLKSGICEECFDYMFKEEDK